MDMDIIIIIAEITTERESTQRATVRASTKKADTAKSTVSAKDVLFIFEVILSAEDEQAEKALADAVAD